MQGRSLLFTLSLLFLLSFSEAKKKSKQPLDAAVTGSESTTVKASLPSGQLSTKDGHLCTWEVLERGTNILLQLSCSMPGEEGRRPSYTCQFAGKPQECSAYSSQASQYWKQVITKFKKRDNACQGEKVLKTRLCKKAQSASHMKLTERSEDETSTPVNKETRDKSKRKTEVPAKKSKGVKKEKEEKKEEDGIGDGYQNTEPDVSYCAEGWSSICSFFVKFFEGWKRLSEMFWMDPSVDKSEEWWRMSSRGTSTMECVRNTFFSLVCGLSTQWIKQLGCKEK